ncbi:MAG: hypothetical protein P1U34_10465 [Coxiellaceae bacterium]|nr:hypothetical protein [Coxiellaceae bacterium]
MFRFFEIKNAQAHLLATFNEEHEAEVREQQAYEAALEAKLAAEQAAVARLAMEAEAKRSAAQAAVERALTDRITLSELSVDILKPAIRKIMSHIDSKHIAPRAAYKNDGCFQDVYDLIQNLPVVPTELEGTQVIDHLMLKFKQLLEIAELQIRSANQTVSHGRAQPQSFYTENNILSPTQTLQFYSALLATAKDHLPVAATDLLRDAYSYDINPAEEPDVAASPSVSTVRRT